MINQIIDPLSIAQNGYNLYDSRVDSITLTSLGFILFELEIVNIKKRGGGGGSNLAPLNIYKPHDIEYPNLDLDQVKKIFAEQDIEQVNIKITLLNQEADLDFSLKLIEQELVKEKDNILIKIEPIENKLNEVKISLEKQDI